MSTKKRFTAAKEPLAKSLRKIWIFRVHIPVHDGFRGDCSARQFGGRSLYGS